MNTIWIAFITGITTGGISCMAVQGGLLASSLAQQGDVQVVSSRKRRFLPVGLFVGAKCIAYTFFGFLLGSLGFFVSLSPRFMGWLQIGVAMFMFCTVARIFDLHPIFRYFVIQPPTWAYRLLRIKSRDSSWFAPALLGLFTIFIPCGVTQAMMAVAVASGNPWIGAAILGAFTLGTSPVFFAIGIAATELLKKKAMEYAAAFALFFFAVLSLNGGLSLLGSIYTLQNFYKAATTNIDVLATGGEAGNQAVVTNGKQDVTITVYNQKYVSSAHVLKAGVPVRLTLVTNDTRGCTRAFTIPSLNITKTLPETGTQEVEFTPQTTGQLAYTCGMGMYSGEFTVIP